MDEGISLGLVMALVEEATGADPAVIEQAVQDWLDAHPEATTTVADGSITEQKLAAAVAAKINQVSSLSDEIASIDDRVTVLENGGTDGASPIINTASGAVASFADGSASPARSAVVTLAPVQDLHGYENPWPAGGGKNKFNSSDKRVSKAIFGNESIGQQATLFDSSVTDTYVNVAYLTVGTWTLSYSMDGTAAATGSRVGYICDADGKVVQKGIATWANTDTVLNIVVTEEGWLWASVDKNTTNLQLESGSTATAYAPYSNICPISGHTGTDIKHSALAPVPIVWDANSDGRYIAENGTMNVSTNFHYSDYLPVGKGLYNYLFTTTDAGPRQTRIHGYNASKTWVKQVGHVATYNGACTVPFDVDDDSIKYIRISNTTVGVTDEKVVPQTVTSLSVTFPTAAGTVYGGTYDFVSGKLIVDWKQVTWNGSNGGEYAPTSQGVKRYVFSISDMKSGNRMNGYCDKIEVRSDLPASGIYCIFGQGNKAIYVMDYDDVLGIDSTNALYAWLTENPVTFVYPLATPIEYDLTPQQLNTLLGVNNAWSTNGVNTAIEYKADTKLYIDGKIAELSALIANL